MESRVGIEELSVGKTAASFLYQVGDKELATFIGKSLHGLIRTGHRFL